MNKITATLAIAAAMGASVAAPSVAFAANSNGNCHQGKGDPNPGHGNDRCAPKDKGTRSVIYLWKAPNDDRDRLGPNPSGIAHGYPQSYVRTFPAGTSWADIEGTLPRPKCGKTLTYQADLYKATQSQLDSLGATLKPGEDSKIGKAWYVYILKGAPCKSEPPAPTIPPVTSPPTNTPTETIPPAGDGTIDPSVPVATSTRTIPTRPTTTTNAPTNAAGVPTVTPPGPVTPPVSSQDGAGVLPYTGSRNGLVVLAATVLLFGGGALLLVARRKS